MEVLLKMMEMDGRGPTIHSRNLHHATAAMYDAWAVFDPQANPFFLGNKPAEFPCAFPNDFPIGDNPDSLRNVAISYAFYRTVHFRFNNYSSKGRTLDLLTDKFEAMGLNPNDFSMDYQKGSPVALGNYISNCICEWGLQDGSREENGHEALNYAPSNPVLKPYLPGTQGLKKPNHWQPISTRDYVDQRGFEPNLEPWNYRLITNEKEFLSPEWGKVAPFAMTKADARIVEKEEGPVKIYHDPGPPPFTLPKGDAAGIESYRWGFLLVGMWSGHLDPADGVMIDISPRQTASPDDFPESFAEYPDYYQFLGGGVATNNRKKNPKTGKPYAANRVPRGDYTRVIAEYWADAVNTASPPGHWFKMLMQVSDHPEFEKRWMGKGKVVDDLEWDIKSYFTLGGTVHDAAIAAWSVKGHYDYIRPVSALRWMGDQGQCSSPQQPHFSPVGLPLIPGRIELVKADDPLVGNQKEHLHKLKIYAWRGPEYIENTATDQAGVGWILVENWWPFQRYSFSTPPFAGYVSGHSTFSIAAAEVLTRITGDPYFPGGLMEFTAKKDAFLVFENGPSQDITLQWATYYDAANETCLSRLWGGIHPPADDMPARLMGQKIGPASLELANQYFGKK
ncbi:MAG: vanadium-dependent haloperoxidase [Salibacteraceae bacterium]